MIVGSQWCGNEDSLLHSNTLKGTIMRRDMYATTEKQLNIQYFAASPTPTPAPARYKFVLLVQGVTSYFCC